MTRGLLAARCLSCTRVVFPRRLWCPDCGGTEFAPELVTSGVVEETTIVRRAVDRAAGEPVRIGAVRLPEGETVVAGLAAGVGAGDRVEVAGGEGAAWAEPLRRPPGS